MSTESADLIQLAASAARTGHTDEARRHLVQLTQREPDNDTAWFWLFGMAESPQEALFCLEKALAINPGHERALAQLKTVRLQAGVAACQAGEKELGRKLLGQVLEEDPASEQAWLWLAALAEAPDEAIAYLQRVLEINPENERALSGINYYRSLPPPTPPVTEAAWHCPLCHYPHEQPQTQCPSCKGILHVQDPELFLVNPGLDPVKAREAMLRYDYILANPAEGTNEFMLHYNLALAHLNLRHFDEGVTHLRVAVSVGKDTHELRQQLDELLRFREHFDRVPGSTLNEAVPKMAWATLTILVVETQPNIRKLVSLTMKRSGFKVLEAANAYELGQTLQVGVPDLVFLQFELSGANGYQVCQMLRNNAQLQTVPVVLMSTKEGFLHRLRGRWSGCSDFITKPFEPEDLLRMVRKHCEAKLFPVGKPPSSIIRFNQAP